MSIAPEVTIEPDIKVPEETTPTVTVEPQDTMDDQNFQYIHPHPPVRGMVSRPITTTDAGIQPPSFIY